MAIGGNRNFAALLDELISEEAERTGGAATSLNSLDYLSVAEELHSGRINFTDKRAQDAYDAEEAFASDETPDAVDEVKAAAEDEPPAALPLSTDPDEIARELGLYADIDAGLLGRIRRDFAFNNHPDRVPSHLRANAMERMQVANMLIDEAKRGKFRLPRSVEARG
ncbi:hypothetical protein JF546_00780 [Nitratireductor aquimarinus]|uniref:hypothetical protein n=1 Tax=Alphaproteobacteria TaxID=28211 RepID=UPI0019D38832|nr:MULTISPECIES: hypothetical protein [Alphaproteobacteria]MBY6021357.1 hypothetical protein [Nitratireductor sp. DP7N14-4]MBN7756571.1 hypothetical protein [Nitratireductor aquimarinus]MBN7776981.1 hypothetical protein [Nitratireductor pacificus]MBN7780315.1 hypothetical protein [Nitratireductor pacificus]MBN7789122.1 hypothetical protein [Nitratireductor aquimarinus]